MTARDSGEDSEPADVAVNRHDRFQFMQNDVAFVLAQPGTLRDLFTALHGVDLLQHGLATRLTHLLDDDFDSIGGRHILTRYSTCHESVTQGCGRTGADINMYACTKSSPFGDSSSDFPDPLIITSWSGVSADRLVPPRSGRG